MIKDSGNRREFDSGAVRDMSNGQKGRCDLLPLGVVSNILGRPNPDRIIRCIFDFCENKTPSVTDLYCALDLFADQAFGGSLETMVLETAIHFQEGAEKYGECNWQKGIPVWCYIDSAVRHYLKFLRGDDDERHDRAFVWNIMCCIWEIQFSGRSQWEEREK